jgi:hypothetical protein
MHANIDSNNSNSSPARHLGELDSQTDRQKSFKGGSDESVCRTLIFEYRQTPFITAPISTFFSPFILGMTLHYCHNGITSQCLLSITSQYCFQSNFTQLITSNVFKD